MRRGNRFYDVRTWLIDRGDVVSPAIYKRYSEFLELHDKLTAMGFRYLPVLPAKLYILPSERDYEER